MKMCSSCWSWFEKKKINKNSLNSKKNSRTWLILTSPIWAQIGKSTFHSWSRTVFNDWKVRGSKNLRPLRRERKKNAKWWKRCDSTFLVIWFNFFYLNSECTTTTVKRYTRPLEGSYVAIEVGNYRNFWQYTILMTLAFNALHCSLSKPMVLLSQLIKNEFL